MAYLSKDFVAKMDDLSKQSTPKMAYLNHPFWLQNPYLNK